MHSIALSTMSDVMIARWIIALVIIIATIIVTLTIQHVWTAWPADNSIVIAPENDKVSLVSLSTMVILLTVALTVIAIKFILATMI